MRSKVYGVFPIMNNYLRSAIMTSGCWAPSYIPKIAVVGHTQFLVAHLQGRNVDLARIFPPGLMKFPIHFYRQCWVRYIAPSPTPVSLVKRSFFNFISGTQSGPFCETKAGRLHLSREQCLITMSLFQTLGAIRHLVYCGLYLHL